jgi:(2Fe-2S) ferredoxin
MSYYRHHLFFCTNKRDDGRKCCADGDAGEMAAYTKSRVKALRLNGPGRVRVSSSGCMDRCGLGPVIAVYPEAVWYSYASTADIDEIVNEHLLHGRIVERLQLHEPAWMTAEEEPS